jgi:hypothetical protein
MGVERHLLGLAWIGADEYPAVVAEPDMGHLHGHCHTVDQHDLVAPVELIGLARFEAQRHEGGRGRLALARRRDPAGVSRGNLSLVGHPGEQPGLVRLWRPDGACAGMRGLDMGRAALSVLFGADRRLDQWRELPARPLADRAAAYISPSSPSPLTARPGPAGIPSLGERCLGVPTSSPTRPLRMARASRRAPLDDANYPSISNGLARSWGRPSREMVR